MRPRFCVSVAVAVQPLLKLESVGEIGQRVEMRDALDLARRASLLGHVLDDGDEGAIVGRLAAEIVDAAPNSRRNTLVFAAAAHSSPIAR